ncbi:MAG: tetratricopeptide repeat protein [Cyclobacteriaceae bacterium]|nr:tetratricopeptide repeat protein [Cyclobacteriaceae bacterium]
MVKVLLKYIAHLLAILLLGVSHPAHCQQSAIDSLEKLLQSKLNNLERVDVLNQLAYAYYDRDDSLAMRYAKRALQEAGSANYLSGKKYACTMVGLGYLSEGEYDQAFQYFRQSDAIHVDDAEETVSYTLSLIGNAYRDLAVFDSSLYYYDRALMALGSDASPFALAPLYKNMAYVFAIQWRNSEALQLLEKAETLATAAGDAYTLRNIWSLYSMVYENMLDFNRAEEYTERMCTSSLVVGDSFHVIRCHLSRANLAYHRGNFQQALKICFEALELSKTYSYPPQLVSLYEQIGDVYSEYSQFDLAFKYYFEALKITEKLQLRYETATLYSSIAWVYKDQSNFDLALDYLEKSQAIREGIGDQRGVANCHNSRGLVYLLQRKYTESIVEQEKGLRIREAINHVEGISASLFNLSLVYEELGQLTKAETLQKQAITIEEKIDNKQNLAISYFSLADLSLKIGKVEQAEEYANRAYALAKQTRSKLLMRNVYTTFSALYEAKENFAKALEYERLSRQLNDSIYSEGSMIKLAEMQALYQLEQKDREIKLLNQDKQIQQDRISLQRSQINMQNIIILSVIIGLGLVSVLAYNNYQYSKRIRKANHEILEQKEEIQAQSEELIEANQTISQINRNLEVKVEERTSALKQAYKELDTFFYRSSHDFRRPLTTFLGLAEVAKITVKDQNALELFDKVKETASNLDKMLVKLQSISDVGAQELVYKEVLVKEIFENVCSDFRDELKRKNIQTSIEVNLRESFVSYPAMVKIIMGNLIENGINFSGMQQPYIKMKAFRKDHELILQVSDNGQGIEQQYQDRIFEMYFRGNERSKGNGLGLYIVKKAVEKLQGTITLESTWGKGSIFTVQLPFYGGTV